MPDAIKCPACGKFCLTEKECRERINYAKRNRMRRMKRIPKGFYHCDDCGWFHLTHYSHNTYSRPGAFYKRDKR